MDCMVMNSLYDSQLNQSRLLDSQRHQASGLIYSFSCGGQISHPRLSVTTDVADQASHHWDGNNGLLHDVCNNDSFGAISDRESATLTPSPTPPPPPRVYKPCFVCGDRSSGYHYGVASCEGCKGFFRRSIQKNMKYSCQQVRNCSITKLTRSRCQFCRLQKCFQVGMLRESVRNERRKKRGKEKKEIEDNTTIPAPIEELIRIVKDAHISTSPNLKSIERFRTKPLQAPSSPTAPSKNRSFDMDLWTQFSERSARCIVKIVEFAKQIPGFGECTIADQITLIKAASMDVLVLRLCSRFQPNDDTMTFSDGLTLDRNEMQSCGFGPITDAVYKFAKSIHPLGLDDTEIGLLCGICIICPDRVDLEEPKKIERLQVPLLEALRLHSRSRRKCYPQIFPKLIMKIADLRTISLRGAEQVETINMEIPSGNMPPLISEMLLRRDC